MVSIVINLSCKICVALGMENVALIFVRVQSFETFFEMEPKLGIFNRVLHRLNYNRFSKTSDFCRFTHFKNFKISSFKKSVVVQFWDRAVGTLVSKNWPRKNKTDPTKLSRNWQTITYAISGQVGSVLFVKFFEWWNSLNFRLTVKSLRVLLIYY